ncbi:ATP-binding protein [Streptomyces boncukensis]|uniref:ATP-binding protein n=1 Tax=Streptomyces boncukensis TaxID=2711219 RepID=A0A6G4X788_9ACTN|nr:ATP-binding protein [Streptomyces boncukensis]
MALVVAQQVPTSSTMTVPHGPAGVGAARRRMREELLAGGVPDAVVDDAVLILSELLSNACRHARPLCGSESVKASWSRDAEGELTVSVTDGGGPTVPLPATPSVSARGGRGLALITALSRDWGVRTGPRRDVTEVTVWAVLPSSSGFSDRLASSLDLDLAAVDESA